MRSAWYVVTLAFGRLRRRGSGALAAALGIAAAAAVLAGILAGATVAKDRGVAQDVERLPSAARAVRAVWFGVPVGEDEAWRSLDSAARAALEPLPRRRADRGRDRQGEHGRRHLRGARRRRRARAARPAPLGSPPPDVHARALRGPAAARRRQAPERSRAAGRRGRHGHPALPPAVRRLSRADRQRPRRRAAGAGTSRRGAVPPPASRAARRRRGRRRARLVAGARSVVSLVRVGPAALCRNTEALADRLARRRGRCCPRRARVAVDVLVSDAAHAGARGDGARRDRGRAQAVARRAARPQRSSWRSRCSPPAPSAATSRPHGDG